MRSSYEAQKRDTWAEVRDAIKTVRQEEGEQLVSGCDTLTNTEKTSSRKS